MTTEGKSRLYYLDNLRVVLTILVLGRVGRVGMPVVLFAALMLPARIFLFGEKIARWQDVFNAAHLWYLEHLLLFSLLYALWHRIRGNRPLEDLSSRPLPRWPAYLDF